MSDILCSYQDREALLMAYLYEEMTPGEREAFDAHLTTCARCRVELNGLSGVRAQLAGWAPPEYSSRRQSAIGGQLVRIEPRVADDVRWTGNEPRAASAEPRSSGRGWRDIPAWAQYAAAVLVLGASMGAANLNIHYDAQNGLNIRTGWSNPQAPAAQTASAVTTDSVSRAELTALEQQLRREIQATAPVAARAALSTDGEVPRRVKALLDASERRHEREMALRIAEAIHDVNVQRQSDLRKIDLNLDQGRVEILKNRQIMEYLQRVSQRQ